MPIQEAIEFQKGIRLTDLLHAAITSGGPHDGILPLEPVLLPALQECTSRTETGSPASMERLAQIIAEMERWQKFLARFQETATRWTLFQTRRQQSSDECWAEQIETLRLTLSQNP